MPDKNCLSGIRIEDPMGQCFFLRAPDDEHYYEYHERRYFYNDICLHDVTFLKNDFNVDDYCKRIIFLAMSVD